YGAGRPGGSLFAIRTRDVVALDHLLEASGCVERQPELLPEVKRIGRHSGAVEPDGQLTAVQLPVHLMRRGVKQDLGLGACGLAGNHVIQPRGLEGIALRGAGRQRRQCQAGGRLADLSGQSGQSGPEHQNSSQSSSEDALALPLRSGRRRRWLSSRGAAGVLAAGAAEAAAGAARPLAATAGLAAAVLPGRAEPGRASRPAAPETARRLATRRALTSMTSMPGTRNEAMASLT